MKVQQKDGKTLYTLIIFSENLAGILNQITNVFTRRQLNIESLNVSASGTENVHCYTITCFSDPETIQIVTRQIEKEDRRHTGQLFYESRHLYHGVGSIQDSHAQATGKQRNIKVNPVVRRENSGSKPNLFHSLERRTYG